MTTDSTVLIVPGLRDHVPEHWQTLLAAKLPKVRTVPPLEQDKLSCAARVEALDQALRAIEGPVIIVAHSAGVMMVAHWALQKPSRHQGALLATPADVEKPFPAGYPTTDALREQGWLPIPRQPLGFPSLLAASENDPLCAFARAQALAQDWGSELLNLGAGRPPQSGRRLRRVAAGAGTGGAARSLSRPLANESRGVGRRGSGGDEAVVAELLAQRGLVQFAGRGVRQSGHEHHVVGQPPFGDARFEEAQHVVALERLAGLDDDQQQRPLLPFRVRDADHRGLGDRGWPIAAFSSAIEEIHSPPDLITSLERSVICM